MMVQVSLEWLNQTQTKIQELEQRIQQEEINSEENSDENSDENSEDNGEEEYNGDRRQWTRSDIFIAMLIYKKLINKNVFLNMKKWKTKKVGGSGTLSCRILNFMWYYTKGQKGYDGGKPNGCGGLTEEIFLTYGHLRDDILITLYETSLHRI